MSSISSNLDLLFNFDYCGDLIPLRLMHLSNTKEPSQTVNSIPHILHYVWFTDKDNPKSMKEGYYSVIENSIIKLNEQADWQVKLWTNEYSLAEQDKKFIESLGIVIENVHRLNLYSNFEDYIRVRKEYISPSDIIRQLVIYEEGGLYTDLDYHIEVDFTNFIDSFDSIFSVETPQQSKIANAVFASKPKGEIVGNIINLLNINIHMPELRPYYVQKPLNKVDEVFVKTGPVAVTEAVYSTLVNNTTTESYIIASHGILSNVFKADIVKGRESQKNFYMPYDMNECGNYVMDDFAVYGEYGFDEFRGDWANSIEFAV